MTRAMRQQRPGLSSRPRRLASPATCLRTVTCAPLSSTTIAQGELKPVGHTAGCSPRYAKNQTNEVLRRAYRAIESVDEIRNNPHVSPVQTWMPRAEPEPAPVVRSAPDADPLIGIRARSTECDSEAPG